VRGDQAGGLETGGAVRSRHEGQKKGGVLQPAVLTLEPDAVGEEGRQKRLPRIALGLAGLSSTLIATGTRQRSPLSARQTIAAIGSISSTDTCWQSHVLAWTRGPERGHFTGSEVLVMPDKRLALGG